ncbi:MAG: DUF951 domain-containing protein [Clostridia bacterium]|nr:DUF951 domain-containing protein [Clostridia bacterium]
MYEVGDVLVMKKVHPCGGNAWTVARVGADIKLCCQTCGKYQNLTRDEIKKRQKSIIKKEDGQDEK